VGFFNWSAPLFERYGDRWRPEDVAAIAGWLRPYVPEEGRLLDLAGGTGALAERLARELRCRVTVLDSTPEMLAYARRRDGVEVVEGPADAMPFEANTFDAVLVSDAFHHFRDQDGAVREMQRVVRCDGGVLVLDMDPRGWMRAVVWSERLLGEPAAFMAPDEMCRFMAERGIDGECRKTVGIGYRFTGTVRELAVGAAT
jgi:demethylmenaquinone methyltransferase/2-methoxy-6-polyprenyl-1,4-benzoquinol methylase